MYTAINSDRKFAIHSVSSKIWCRPFCRGSHDWVLTALQWLETRGTTDFENRTPYKLAWDRILINHRTVDWREKLKSLFTTPDFDDLYSFTHLHKAILGLEGYSLSDKHFAIPNDVDLADTDGRTPLWWAASEMTVRP